MVLIMRLVNQTGFNSAHYRGRKKKEKKKIELNESLPFEFGWMFVDHGEHDTH